MTTVRHILSEKRPGTWTIVPGSTVFEALQRMAEKDVGALLVVDGDGRLTGIFSERDYARKGILLGRLSKDTPIGDVMTTRVYYVTPDHRLEECLALMTEKHVRHLPVLEQGRICGVVSIGDVGKALIADREFIIANLERYISGER